MDSFYTLSVDKNRHFCLKLNEDYYTVTFKIQEVDGVIHSDCLCVSGEGEDPVGAVCKHAASLFFHINEHEWPISKTDVQCSTSR